MLPFEFTVSGTPVSHQSHNKALLRQWQQAVRRAAEQLWPVGTAPVRADCLLIGLVYEDDRQITDTVIRRTDIRAAFYIQDESAPVALAIRRGEEFVYVRVDVAPDHRRLL